MGQTEVAERIVVLPSASVIMARLQAINPDSDLCERFYPLIAQSAGMSKNAKGLVLVLIFAMINYTKDSHDSMRHFFEVRSKISTLIPALVEDAEVADLVVSMIFGSKM